MTQDVNTILVDMPCSIRAYTVANADLTYTVVINAKLNHELQIESYQHELEHITNGDYDRKYSADLIEFYAHN